MSYIISLSYVAAFGQEGRFWHETPNIGAVTPVIAGSANRKKSGLNDGEGHKYIFGKLTIFPPCFQAGRGTPALWGFFALGSCTTICIQFYLIKRLDHLTSLGRKSACGLGLIAFASRAT